MTTIVTVGHVDHGKSTILGHLILKLGLISEHEWKKICEDAKEEKMEPWRFARILDIYDEERANGKTLEHTSVPVEIEDEKIIFVDTPGHNSLVKEVIQGMTNAVICMIIISARTGEFESGWSGQTKEHLYIARGMGISNVIVVWNKMDTIDWNKEIIKTNRETVGTFLKKIGMRDISETFISGLTGEGLLENFKTVILKHVFNYKNKISSVIKIPEKTSMLHIEALFIGNGVYSSGWKGIFHAGYFEAEMEIVKIKGKPFIKEGEQAQIVIKIFNEPNTELSKNCIIRTQDSTIAMGKIIAGK